MKAGARQASAFWSTFDRATPCVRREWLLSVLEAAFERPPGISAVVGRGRLSDLRSGWATLTPNQQRTWFAEFLIGVPDLCDIAASLLADRRAQGAGAVDHPVERFLATCTRRAFGSRTPAAALHHRYLEWAVENNERSMTARLFSFRLKDLGCHSIKSSRTQWIDIEIVASTGASALGLPAGRAASGRSDRLSSQAPKSGSLPV